MNQANLNELRAASDEIRFTVGECSLGSILVACSERGVCAILIGDQREALVDDLLRRFRNARLTEAGPELRHWRDRLVELVDDPTLAIDLPLDPRGTAFQRRVWQALREIPAGQTRSYADLARHIGAPTAARAVGHACGANALAVAIPCHRAVRSDGGLSGYRWGLERKRALLEREARA